MSRKVKHFIFPFLAIGLIGCAPDTPVAVKAIDVEDIEPFRPETLQNFFKINLEQAQSLLENNQDVFILDLRAEAEFASGHLQGANNFDVFFMVDGDPNTLNFGFQQSMGVMNRALKVLIYCNGEPDIDRAIAATRVLKAIGFNEVYWMKEGIDGWKEAGLPIINDLALSSAP